ncbi:hypothetical protein FRC04_005300 [Tulasnella sp. 424]|nr:hypothetical protein FRC04_005300 [Tulasnella sp. 424]KAG8976412.1 hypothetical protein FRC05_003655 [Tulasnella sp. 425]
MNSWSFNSTASASPFALFTAATSPHDPPQAGNLYQFLAAPASSRRGSAPSTASTTSYTSMQRSPAAPPASFPPPTFASFSAEPFSTQRPSSPSPSSLSTTGLVTPTKKTFRRWSTRSGSSKVKQA